MQAGRRARACTKVWVGDEGESVSEDGEWAFGVGEGKDIVIGAEWGMADVDEGVVSWP